LQAGHGVLAAPRAVLIVDVNRRPHALHVMRDVGVPSAGLISRT
jgi:hypothetical protein